MPMKLIRADSAVATINAISVFPNASNRREFAATFTANENTYRIMNLAALVITLLLDRNVKTLLQTYEKIVPIMKLKAFASSNFIADWNMSN